MGTAGIRVLTRARKIQFDQTGVYLVRRKKTDIILISKPQISSILNWGFVTTEMQPLQNTAF